MDLEKIGLDRNLYLKIKKLARGENISFSNSERETIRKTTTYGKNGGKLSHIADSTRKKFSKIDKMIYNSRTDRNTTSDYNNLDIQEKTALSDEYERAKKTKNEYNKLISDLKKLTNKKTKNLQETAESIVKNLRLKKNNVTTSRRKMLEIRMKERERKINIGFASGLISDSEIDDLLLAIGKNRSWYYNQMTYYKSLGYASDRAIDMVKDDISNIALDLVHDLTYGETFINDDGSDMTQDEVNQRMIDLGVSKIIIKFLELVEGISYMKSNDEKSDEIINMWDNWDNEDKIL